MTVKNKNRILYIVGAVLALALLGACSAPSTPVSTPTSTTLPPTATQTIVPSVTNTATPEPTPTPPDATSFPDPSGYAWAEVVSGLNRPIGLVSAGDGSGRLFIIEQPGRILIHDGSGLLVTPFLDIRDRVFDKGSEQGLLGLAFHPDYEENGLFFVSYTDKDWKNVISRFRLTSDLNQADPESESIVLSVPQPYKNHNGGQILFGPEGYLWIAVGDGGSAGDPQGNGQNLNTLLGSLLRIDINQEPYAIPGDNAFGNEIWAYGLRNPWRFTFDPVTHDLYVADVGQAKWEEVNFLAADTPPGTNFGWDYREGKHGFEGTPAEGLAFVDPVAEYDHGQGCSVSGGAVYRGSLSEWQGIYLYADFCSGTVWGLLQSPDGEWQNKVLFQLDSRIAAIDQDEAGELYLLDLLGTIFKLTSQD